MHVTPSFQSYSHLVNRVPGSGLQPQEKIESEPLETPPLDARELPTDNGPLIPDPSSYPAASRLVVPYSLHTEWGFGARENRYNALIESSTSGHWRDPEYPLSSLTFKALIAAESSFDPNAVSRTGAAGLVQITPGTARDYGVRTSPPPDQRFDPEIAVPAGVRILYDKHALIKAPPENRDYGKPVSDFYEQVGRPDAEQMKTLALAGYNGGASTVLRAMNYALQDGRDPRDWSSLTSEDRPLHERPLYKAVVDSFGGGSAAAKFREMADYPGKILAYENRTFQPLSGRKIMVDPGHGGTDPGAIGHAGTQEKDVALSVSIKLRDKLEALGAEVRMTRETDRNVSRPGASQSEELQARVALANSWPAEVFVSVHCNAVEDRSAHGTETYHSRNASQASKRLAAAVNKEMVDATGFRDRGVKEAGFYVITHTRMPAVLVETGFISNPVEEKELLKPEVQDRMAQAMTNGLVQVFGPLAQEDLGHLVGASV